MVRKRSEPSWVDRVLHWRLRRRWRPICEQLGLCEQADDVRHLSGEWRGRSVRVRYRAGHRGERPRLSFHVAGRLPVGEALQFRRMGWIDWLAKATGLSREAEASDPLFDRQVYCESWDDRQAAALVAERRVRECVLAALKRRRTELSCEPDGVWLTIRGHWGWGKHFHPKAVARVFEQLAALADSIARVDGEGAASRKPADAPTPREAIPPMKALPGVAKGLVLFGLVSMFLGPLVLWLSSWYPTLTWRLHGWGFALGGGLLAAYLLVTITWLRGRSRAHRDLAVFGFAGLVGFPTLCIGALVLVNGVFDGSPPMRVEAEVLAHRRSDGNLYAQLAIDAPGHTQTVRMRWRVREELPTDAPVRVDLKSGTLGEPWIVDVAVDQGNAGAGGKGTDVSPVVLTRHRRGLGQNHG